MYVGYYCIERGRNTKMVQYSMGVGRREEEKKIIFSPILSLYLSLYLFFVVPT